MYLNLLLLLRAFVLKTSVYASRYVVPRPRIELGTRGFSVRQENLCIEILTHLAAVGQDAEKLLLLIQQGGHEDRAKFGALAGQFSTLREIPLGDKAKHSERGEQ